MKRSTFLKSLIALGFSAIIGSTGAIAGESPDLAAMVKAGTLPPLNERLPEIPLMLPVVDEIGQYGGTLRRAFLGLVTTTTIQELSTTHWFVMHQTEAKLFLTSPQVGNPTKTLRNGLFV